MFPGVYDTLHHGRESIQIIVMGSHLGTMYPLLKGKIHATELKYLIQKCIFNFKGLYRKKQNDKFKRTSSLKSTVLQWKTSPIKSTILRVLWRIDRLLGRHLGKDYG
jgi:hypothetical protein